MAENFKTNKLRYVNIVGGLLAATGLITLFPLFVAVPRYVNYFKDYNVEMSPSMMILIEASKFVTSPIGLFGVVLIIMGGYLAWTIASDKFKNTTR